MLYQGLFHRDNYHTIPQKRYRPFQYCTKGYHSSLEPKTTHYYQSSGNDEDHDLPQELLLAEEDEMILG